MIESFNKVDLTGKVADISINTGTAGAENKKYIAGDISIETSEDNIIPVSFFQYITTKDGNENKGYTAMQTIAEEFKTITKDGREEADTVQVNGAKLEENTYYTDSGALNRGFRVAGRFFNRKAGADADNQFTVEGTVLNISEEINEDVPTGRVFIDLLVIGYGDRPHVLKLVVEGEDGANWVKTSLQNEDQAKFAGKIRFSKTEKEVSEKSSFGPDITRIITNVEKSLVVTSATPAVPTTLSQEEIKTALAEREGKFQAAKEKSSRTKKKEAKPETTRGNFTL